jgi:lipid-A-disaccharide synthase
MNLHVFIRLLNDARRIFREEMPDAVVLIDYPGFNWHIARAAKEAGIPVFYYSPPQIWAWASWRVKKMRRFVDHVLCGLPFEEAWFRQHGCNATFVGHPYFDEVEHCQLDAAFLAEQRQKPGQLVTILPGSRTQEVTHNLQWFLKAAKLVKASVPDARFAIASFKPHQAEMARRQLAQLGLEAEVHVGRTPELIHLADCAMACSGSVSLELLYHTKPTVVLYWISRLAFQVQKWFRKVKYITLVNLLTTDELFPKDVTPFDPNQPGAERVLFPEYLTCEDKSAQIAAHAIEWLSSGEKRQARIDELAALKKRVCHGGASRVAAQYIVKAIRPAGHPLPAPHIHFPAAAEHSASAQRARA